MENKWVNVKTEDGTILNIPYTAYLKDFKSRGCALLDEEVQTDKPNDDVKDDAVLDKETKTEDTKDVEAEVERPNTVNAHLHKPKASKEKKDV